MKWGVFCLLMANVLAWFAAAGLNHHSLPRDVAHGRLPRVAPIEIAGPTESLPLPQSAASEPPDQQDLPADSGADGPGGPCIVVGWFRSAAAAREAAAGLGYPVPAKAVVRQVSRPAPPYHWVILPPANSREAALNRLAEIQQQGIDSYLVTEGAHANAISLGLFESLDAAEAILSRSQSQGLEATLATFPRNHIRYALVFPAQFRDANGSLSQARKALENRFGSVTFGRCEGVATTQKNP